MALNGVAVTVKLGTNGIAGINNSNLDMSADMLDVTDFDSLGDREFIPGLRGATMTMAGDLEMLDTNGQAALIAAFLASTLLTGATQPQLTFDGTNGFGADAYVSSFSPE